MYLHDPFNIYCNTFGCTRHRYIDDFDNGWPKIQTLCYRPYVAYKMQPFPKPRCSLNNFTSFPLENPILHYPYGFKRSLHPELF